LPHEPLRHQPMPDLYLSADGQWQLLRPMLLTAALDWIDPHGSHGWAPPNSIMSSIEPVCSALNLCRFLLLREQAHSSNYTEVRHGLSQPSLPQVLFMCVGCVPVSHMQCSVFLPSVTFMAQILAAGCTDMSTRNIFCFAKQAPSLKCFQCQSRNCRKTSFCVNCRYAHHQASLF